LEYVERIQSFLENEVSDQEYYDGIIDFLWSSNIRCGEYEGNQYVIQKVDQYNFILFEEYVIDGKREVHNAFSLHKSKLMKYINEYANMQGFSLKNRQ
jgi:hypothetical protein